MRCVPIQSRMVSYVWLRSRADMLEPSSLSLRSLSAFTALERLDETRTDGAVPATLWDKDRRSASVCGCASVGVLETTEAGAIVPIQCVDASRR